MLARRLQQVWYLWPVWLQMAAERRQKPRVWVQVADSRRLVEARAEHSLATARLHQQAMGQFRHLAKPLMARP